MPIAGNTFLSPSDDRTVNEWTPPSSREKRVTQSVGSGRPDLEARCYCRDEVLVFLGRAAAAGPISRTPLYDLFSGTRPGVRFRGPRTTFSRDWMPRNFFRWVETMFLIESKKLREKIRQEVIERASNDNCWAQDLDSEGNYHRRHRCEANRSATHKFAVLNRIGHHSACTRFIRPARKIRSAQTVDLSTWRAVLPDCLCPLSL